MAGKFELKAIISAVDKLSPALKTINRTARLTSKALKDIGRAGQNLSSALGVPVAIASAVTVEALRRMVSGFAEYGSKIHDATTKTGQATKQLQELAYAAKLEGVEFETLTGGTIKLNKAIAGAASGKNKEAAKLFKKLGVNLRDSNGHLRDAGELMPEVADGLNRIKNPAQRTAATLAIFGKSGAELYPFLALGAKGMAEAAKEARALGLVLSDDDIKNADELGDNFDRIRAATQGLSNTIGARLAPVLNPLIAKLLEWYKVNRELIGQQISGAVIKLAAAIEKIDWKAVIDGVSSFANSLSGLAQFVGGWSNLMIGFFALANAHIIIAIGEIGVALYRLGAILFLVAGWWAIPIAAAIAAMFMLWKNWDKITNWIGDRLLAVKDWFADMVDSVTGFFNAIPEAFEKAIKRVLQYLPDLTRITDGVKGAWRYITGGGPATPMASNDNTPSPLQQQNFRLQPIRQQSLLKQGALSGNGAAPAQPLTGEISVKFENAPKGLRVQPAQTNQRSVTFNTDVGYSSNAMGQN